MKNVLCRSLHLQIAHDKHHQSVWWSCWSLLRKPYHNSWYFECVTREFRQVFLQWSDRLPPEDFYQLSDRDRSRQRHQFFSLSQLHFRHCPHRQFLFLLFLAVLHPWSVLIRIFQQYQSMYILWSFPFSHCILLGKSYRYIRSMKQNIYCPYNVWENPLQYWLLAVCQSFP